MKKKVKWLSCVQLFATPWTVAHQAPLSMGFSGQEYWSGLPFLSPGNLPDPGTEPRSPTLQAGALTSEPPGKPCQKKRVSLISQTSCSPNTYGAQEMMDCEDQRCTKQGLPWERICCPPPGTRGSFRVCLSYRELSCPKSCPFLRGSPPPGTETGL